MGYQIDVDSEVYDRLKWEAEKRLETPNTVLRRLLKLDPQPVRVSKMLSAEEKFRPSFSRRLASEDNSASYLSSIRVEHSSFDSIEPSEFHTEHRIPFTENLPALPHHIPTTLEHTLQMVHLVRTQGMTRIEATKVLADWHRVAIPTVTIKFTRLLGISAHEIDELLLPARRSDLVGLLTSHFPGYEDVIRDVV